MNMARHTGKSILKTLRYMDLAEELGMLCTKSDGTVEIY